MKKLSAYLIAKALAGLIVLVPVAILFVAAMEVWGLLQNVAAFASIDLPFPSVINALIYLTVIVTAIFGVCALTGLLINTRIGQRFADFVENSIAERIPLIGLLRNLTLSLTDSANSQLKPAEVDIQGSGTCMLGFLMEVLPDGRNVVFVPSAPAITLGQVLILPADRVRLLDAPITSVVNAVTQWGTGTAEVFKKS